MELSIFSRVSIKIHQISPASRFRTLIEDYRDHIDGCAVWMQAVQQEEPQGARWLNPPFIH